MSAMGSYFQARRKPCSKLLPARAHPRRIMTLSDSHALMSSQNRDSFERNAGEKQFTGECVTEAVRVSTLDFGQREQGKRTYREGFESERSSSH
jgi:hypothetical protein